MARSIDELAIQIHPTDRAIAEVAARLGGTHPRLRLPDVLVIATAIQLDATHLVTTDARWPTARRLGFDGELMTVRAKV